MLKAEERLRFALGVLAPQLPWREYRVISQDTLGQVAPGAEPLIVLDGSDELPEKTASLVSALAGAGTPVLLIAAGDITEVSRAWLTSSAAPVFQMTDQLSAVNDAARTLFPGVLSTEPTPPAPGRAGTAPTTGLDAETTRRLMETKVPSSVSVSVYSEAFGIPFEDDAELFPVLPTHSCWTSLREAFAGAGISTYPVMDGHMMGARMQTVSGRPLLFEIFIPPELSASGVVVVRTALLVGIDPRWSTASDPEGIFNVADLMSAVESHVRQDSNLPTDPDHVRQAIEAARAAREASGSETTSSRLGGVQGRRITGVMAELNKHPEAPPGTYACLCVGYETPADMVTARELMQMSEALCAMVDVVPHSPVSRGAKFLRWP